jgi:hypothetical protein
MLLYSPRWLFLYPGATLMIAGTVVGVMVLPGPLMVSPRVGLDVHTLLFAAAAILIGFKGFAFAFCARIYALQEGLLPEDKALARMFRHFTLETGLAAGLILVVLGLIGALLAVAGWSQAGFGSLEPRETLRLAIPAATALCLGGDLVFTSFLLSFLGLRRRSHG